MKGYITPSSDGLAYGRRKQWKTKLTSTSKQIWRMSEERKLVACRCTISSVQDLGTVNMQITCRTKQGAEMKEDHNTSEDEYRFASDFTGMECEACVFTKLWTSVNARQMLHCEHVKFARGFVTNNYWVEHTHVDVMTRPMPNKHKLYFYAARPQCQGLSAAGLRM